MSLETDAPPMVNADHAVNAIRAEIGNRQTAMWDLEKKMAALQGELNGLREAQDKIERLKK